MPRTRSQTSDSVKSVASHFKAKSRASRTTIKNLVADNNSATSNSCKKVKTNKGKAIDSGSSNNHVSQFKFAKIGGTRSRNTDSSCSESSAVESYISTSSMVSSSSSSKENTNTSANKTTICNAHIENARQNHAKAPTRQPFSPKNSQNISQNNKRKRPVQRDTQPFDFSDSPNSGKECVEKIKSVNKRQKISVTPRSKNPSQSSSFIEECSKQMLNKKDSSDLVELIGQVPTTVEQKQPEVVAAEPKQLSMKERIARLKEKKAAKALETTAVTVKETPQEAPKETPEPAKKLSVKERIAKIKQQKLLNEQKAKENNATQACSTPKLVQKTSSTQSAALSEKLSKIKAKVAESKISRQLDQEKSNEAIQALERAKEEKELLTKAWMEEKINKIQTHMFRSFKLPNSFEKLRKHFVCLDEILMSLNNRKETVTVSRMERDVSRYNGVEAFKKDVHLRKIMTIKPDSHILEWKKGLRIEDSVTESCRIKSDAYQLTIRPNLANLVQPKRVSTPTKNSQQANSSGSISSSLSTWARMTVKHLHQRKEDFWKRLLLATDVYHCLHIFKSKNNNNLTYEEVVDKYSIEHTLNNTREKHINCWDPAFLAQIENGSTDPQLDCGILADFPLNPASDSLFSTPSSVMSGGSLGRLGEPGTPMSARRLLDQFCDKEKKKTIIGDSKLAQNSIDSGCSFESNQIDQNQQIPKAESDIFADKQAKLRADLEQKYRNQGLSEKLIQKTIKRELKEQENNIFKQQLNKVKEVNEIKSLYDIARGIKSYFTVNRSSSGSLSEIVGNLIKNSASSLSWNDVSERIERLVNLDDIKAKECLKVELAGDGEKYIKMKPRTTLVSFNNAIKLTLERCERD